MEYSASEKSEQGQASKALTPNMPGYRPTKDWFPDLTYYKKSIFLRNIALDDIKALLEQYASIYGGSKHIPCVFHYTPFYDSEWVCLEVPTISGVPHYQSFFHFQNLMLWMSQKADRVFCLAIPEKPSFPLFLSVKDAKNPFEEVTKGVYADRDFYFIVPEEILEWGAVPTCGFNYAGYLKDMFHFDTQELSQRNQAEWLEETIILCVEEE